MGSCSRETGSANTPGVVTATCIAQRAARRMLLSDLMNKPNKRTTRRTSRSGGVVDRSATTDVVTQLECAVRNPRAAALGAVIGGIIPWFARTLAHSQVPAAWAHGQHGIAAIMIAVVLGCACFSALTVYKFGRAAFGDARKAIGFVLALEGVMLVSTDSTSIVALVVLILINAVANGSIIALARDATRRRCEADARGAATRARNRIAASVPAHRAPSAPSVQAVEAKATRRAARPAKASSTALAPTTWRRATLDDVADAVIVSETLAS